MPETVGLLLLTAAAEVGVPGVAGFALTSTTIAGVSAATIVGSAAIIGVSIGLQYALNNPEVPKPENGVQSLKQTSAPRRRGYWLNRLGGVYMLYLPAGGDSQDMLAFHSGKIEEFIQIYLHDTAVSTTPAIAHSTVLSVNAVGADGYAGTSIELFDGRDGQTTFDMLNLATTAGTWTSDFVGNGIACGAMICQTASDPTEHTKRFPQGLPILSVVAKCAPTWDPREVTQSRFDRSTWRASPNPVVQLIDYLTEADGGMGESLDDILPAAALAQWMEEADLCEGRYSSAGWYLFDNSPENVIGKILASCDGWMSEAGDGSLALTVGVYRAPLDAPLTAKHILGWSVKDGIADEELINQLDVTYTNPDLGYVSDQIDPVRDEDSISSVGYVRSKPLDLSWVQNETQADFLGQRALLRVNPAKTGTFVTDLFGMNYLGKRWIPVQFPEVPGLEDVVVEIQDRAEVDLLNGRVTFMWNLVDVEALTALGALQQAILRQDGSFLERQGGTPFQRQN